MRTLVVVLIVLLVFGSFVGCKNRRNSDIDLLEYGISPPGKGDEGGGEGGGQQPVPEPCTLLLVGGGLVIIGLRKGKRK